MAYDRRLHPVRPDIAAESYRGIYEAERYSRGIQRRIVSDKVPMTAKPRLDQPIDTEILYGEGFTVFEETPDGWAWGQLETDGYVGWVPSEALSDMPETGHIVSALRTYRYPMPDLKFPPRGLLSMGARVAVTDRTTVRGLDYAKLSDGSFVVAKHLSPLNGVAGDWVAVAEEFLGTPYLWGGRSSLGLDCSALVQLAAQRAGISVARDSDMQERSAGIPVKFDGCGDGLSRGDLIFWKGHVAIVTGPNKLIHANGYTMTVAFEEVQVALSRIAETEWGDVTSVRRLEAGSN
ncbi:cell wall-associated NlpC family hydrolase [Roseibium hamelinense]|uniref:Cell wall-associated NlpC family hydrolase n=1 Tax=Roseibium hamelinense TaxID=150831 RepID=A0A562SHK3_9HYPH|nr:NlpC/P60 family protein [Roseibium hamelinense]MTI43908.1 glycoside hydrolase [Roseibium hamelinense]TWI80797.1 cell wall-associated NlpC family hydrolase [Roseibium hamelinense]